MGSGLAIENCNLPHLLASALNLQHAQGAAANTRHVLLLGLWLPVGRAGTGGRLWRVGEGTSSQQKRENLLLGPAHLPGHNPRVVLSTPRCQVFWESLLKRCPMPLIIDERSDIAWHSGGLRTLSRPGFRWSSHHKRARREGAPLRNAGKAYFESCSRTSGISSVRPSSPIRTQAEPSLNKTLSPRARMEATSENRLRSST